MSQKVNIHGSLLVKNTALNFIGQALPLLVAVATIPFIIRGLGTERFGIFSIVWVILGYFSLFDFGLGRTTTKFVAEVLGKGESEKVPTILWTSLGFVSLLGLIGAIVLVVLTPFFVERVLNIPSNLIEETKLVFYISSVSILITLVTATLRGLLEAYQRFDLVNMLRVPSNVMSSVIPIIGLYFGAGLPDIVLFLVMKNLGMVFIYFLFCFKLMPKARFFSWNLKLTPSLFSFGGWLTIIYITSSVRTYLNQFLIGSCLSMSAVAYYTLPYKMVSYLWILPTSFFMTLFPAFSAIGRTRKEDLECLFTRSLKHLILLTGPIVLVLVLFAEEILHLWLGSEFAVRSALVLQILAIGFFLNCQAWIPSTLLQGTGRPDVVAKLFLFELPFYVGVAWWLIGKMDIEGAALAWALFGGLEAVLFFIAARKVLSFRFSVLAQNGVIRGVIALGGLALTVSVTALLFRTIWLIQAIVTTGLMVLFALIVWRYVLDAAERSELKVVFLRVMRRIQVAK